MEFNVLLYKDILDNLYEGVYFVDPERTITYWNKSAERITGYMSSEVIGRRCYNNILNHVDDKNNQLCLNGCPLYHSIKDGRTREAGVYLRHKNGHRVFVAVRTIPLYQNNCIIGAVEVFTDDSERAQINNTINELKDLALTDTLTGLPNRRYIDTFLSNRMVEFLSLEIPFSVAMIDIDLFKVFNDTYGHDVGDLVLKMVSKTMRNTVRGNDFIGRWGGEEFLLGLISVKHESLKVILENVRTLVAKSALPYELSTLSVTISIGGTDAQKGDTLDGIIKRADNALYLSKKGGRNRTTII